MYDLIEHKGRSQAWLAASMPPRRGHDEKSTKKHIPRPPNAFILFRSSFIRSNHVPGKVEGNHSTLSKIIGTGEHLSQLPRFQQLTHVFQVFVGRLYLCRNVAHGKRKHASRRQSIEPSTQTGAGLQRPTLWERNAPANLTSTKKNLGNRPRKIQIFLPTSANQRQRTRERPANAPSTRTTSTRIYVSQRSPTSSKKGKLALNWKRPLTSGKRRRLKQILDPQRNAALVENKNPRLLLRLPPSLPKMILHLQTPLHDLHPQARQHQQYQHLPLPPRLLSLLAYTCSGALPPTLSRIPSPPVPQPNLSPSSHIVVLRLHLPHFLSIRLILPWKPKGIPCRPYLGPKIPPLPLFHLHNPPTPTGGHLLPPPLPLLRLIHVTSLQK